MLAVFIHNPFDANSAQLLMQARRRFHRLEVYDFQAVRSLLWVQGAPCVWLFRDDQDPFRDQPAYREDLEVDLDRVAAVAPDCRVASVHVSATQIYVGGSVMFAVTLTDLDGNVVTGEEVQIETWASTPRWETIGLRRDVLFDKPGNIRARVIHPTKHMAPVELEIMVQEEA